MRQLKQVPKLGAIQRWVAGLGPGCLTEPAGLALLDAVLRVASGLGEALGNSNMCSDTSGKEVEPLGLAPVLSTEAEHSGATLEVFPAWAACDATAMHEQNGCNGKDDEQEHVETDHAQQWRAKFLVVATEKGPERTPPNKYPLRIYHPKADSFSLQGGNAASAVRMYPVPDVAGAFVLTDVLSAVECKQLRQCAEANGFVPDVPAGRTAALAAPGSDPERAANFTMLADSSLLEAIYTRCKPHLPQQLADGCELRGLNARFRFYRYYPGATYRPHVDGAWPGSGLDEDGHYCYDRFGDRRSRLTMVVYLNEGFDGGAIVVAHFVHLNYLDFIENLGRMHNFLHRSRPKARSS
eukprot:SAG31_NODE_4082_length_3608_cov_2.026788_4_plen_353_part_00